MLTIKIGKSTERHAQALRTLGYVVTDGDDHIIIDAQAFEGTEFVWTKKNVQALVSERKMLTYQTKVVFEDGKVLSSILACGRMGVLSCLMAKEEKTKKQLVSLDVDDILG